MTVTIPPVLVFLFIIFIGLFLGWLAFGLTFLFGWSDDGPDWLVYLTYPVPAVVAAGTWWGLWEWWFE